MRIELPTVRAALDQHRQWYAERESAPWDTSYHAGLWQKAHVAFHEKSFPHFQQVYNELRSRWQVFRGSHESHWTAQQVFEALRRCNAIYAERRLSELTMDDAAGLWAVLHEMAGVKKLGDGPAVVAVSKFLHFWNPKLFVIVDYAMVWAWVFRHHWLWEPVLKVREGLFRRVGLEEDSPVGGNCDVLSYLAILLWGGSLMRDNPAILEGFKEYVSPVLAGHELAGAMVNYEAVALEWFLLGVVELPPHGVTR